MFGFLRITALFLVGIFFNVHFFWCHWLGFVGLWFLYQENRGKFLKGFLLPCGLVFFVVYAAYLYWLLRYEFWIYFFGTLILSLIFPLFFVVCHLIAQRSLSAVLNMLVAFGVFALFEFVLASVSLTGTAAIDFFFHAPVVILRILHFMDPKIGCAWLMATCFVAAAWAHKRSWKRFALLGISLTAMGILIGAANISMRPETSGPRHPVKISLIQHNLPFSEEWRIDHPSEVKKKYEVLALEAAKDHPDLIIFPQYTFPEDIYRNPGFFSGLARKTKAYILVASHVPAEAGKSVFDFGYMNLALLFTPDGKLGGKYQAVEEAPFGGVRQRSAEKYQVIGTPFGKLGVLLCYEDVTSKAAKEALRAGAKILVSLSNPGMFLDTHMPYYYLQQDQLRVMETGLPLLRVSPNGYTAFIDKTGRMVQRTQLNSAQVLQVELDPSRSVSGV